MIKFRYLALGGLTAVFFFLSSSQVVAQEATSPVITGVISAIHRTSADFTWIATDEDQIAGVSFAYGPTQDYALTSSVKFTYTFTSSGLKYNFSTTANNLTAGTQNYFKIIVVDSKNIAANYTGSVTIPAADLTPPVISRVTVATQSQSATVSWETDRASDSKVSYHLPGGATIVKALDNLTAGHHVYLGNLISGATYYYTISSADANGNISVLGERTFKTEAEAGLPSDVGNFELTATNGFISLSWKNPVDVNFSRVVVVRKVGDQPDSPSDGVMVYSGRDQSFTDRSVLRGNNYFYTIYSSNNSGSYSGGATNGINFGKISGTEAVPVATVSSSRRIKAEDLKFFTSDHQVEKFLVNGVVTGTPGANFSVHLSPIFLAYTPVKMVLNISGQTHNSYFAQNEHRFDFVFHLGRNNIYIKIDYNNGLVDVIPFIAEGVGASISTPDKPITVVQPPPPLVQKAAVIAPTIIQDIQDTAAVVSNIKNNERVQKAVTQVVAPTVVGVTAVSVITILSWVNILHFFQLILVEPLLIFSRRRRRADGQVYNSLDKMPVVLATVRLINKDTGNVVQSKVTDSKGRYSFMANPGTYVIKVFKRDFSFPSITLLGQKDDGRKTDIYHGDAIKVTESGTILAVNIPVDPTGAHRRLVRLSWLRILLWCRAMLNWVGFAVIIISLYISPRWYTWLLLVLHLSTVAVSNRFATTSVKAKDLGRVYDSKTNLPIGQAVVRLYNAKFDKMVSSQVTDSRGRYYFIAGDDEYYVTAERAGYILGKTAPLNLRGKESQGVAIDIGLKKA